MKKLNKLFAAALAVCLAFSAFSVSAKQEKAQIRLFASAELISQGDIPIVTDTVSDGEILLKNATAGLDIYDYLAEKLAEGVYAADKEKYGIDISMYNIAYSVKDDSLLNAVISRTLNSHPELFYVERAYGFYINPDGIVVEVCPTYDSSVYDGSVFEKIARYNSELDAIVKLVPDGITDLQKILLIHDYIVDRCKYDTSYTKYDAYTMLTENTGVCQAYTMLFMAVMQRLGIECTYASSENLNHIWNVVKLDGKYYHIDLTHDDPVYSNDENRQTVNHTYFLLSTDSLIKLSSTRSDWVSPYLEAKDIASTDYEAGYCWENIKTPFFCIDGEFYGIRGNSGKIELFKCSSDLKTSSEVIAVKFAVWRTVDGNGYWSGIFSGFSRMGNTLICNTSDSVWYCRKVDGGWETGVLPYEKTVFGNYYDSKISKNGQLLLSVGKTPNDALYIDYVSVDLAYAVSGNNWAQAMVNTRKALFGNYQPEVNTDFLDMNGDNIIDIRDLVKMKKQAASAA